MPASKSTPKKKTSHAMNSNHTSSESAMPTSKTQISHAAHAAHSNEPTTEAVMSKSIDLTESAPPSTSSTAAPPPPSTSDDPGFLLPPPPPADIPIPPTGFVADNTQDFRGVIGRSSELNSLPMAVQDLARFKNYGQVIGGTAPSLAQVQQAFNVTNQWSATRTQSRAWDEYCRTQEGVAWSFVRPMMDRLRPAYALAVKTDPSLPVKYPGLTTFLGAKQVIAHKGVATRKANKEDVAAGKPKTHGKVGKQTTKKAQKAALLVVQAQEAVQPPTQQLAQPSASPPPAPANGGAQASAPSAAPAAPVAAAVTPPGATNGAANGSH